MYKLVVAGGTFDLLHKGHKSFLIQVLKQTDKLILGLTSDKYVLDNKDENTQKYEIRKKNLENFLKSINKSQSVEIVPINDLYGPLLDPDFKPDIIAVTKETKKSAETINEKRVMLGLPALPFIVIPMAKASDELEISSTRIKRGEIDRQGKVYFKKKWQGKNFRLPDNLREELSKPFGEVLDHIPTGLDTKKIITVGDVTTKLFNEKGIGQFLSVVDFRIHREKIFNSIKELEFKDNIKAVEINNPKGTISSDLIESIKKAFQNKKRDIILINGEDDLAVLPILIFSPLGYSVFYGQPAKGLVWIKVSEENKEKAFNLISSFEIY